MAAAPGLLRPGSIISRAPREGCAKVVIADQLTLMREGLAAICLSPPPLYDVVGQCADGQAALKLIREFKPELAVLDLHLPSLDTIEVIRELKASGIKTRTAVLSTRGDRKTVLEALRGGACAFLLKSGSSKHLMTALEQMRSGGIYLSPDLNIAEIFVLGRPRRRCDTDDPLERLSPREFQVFTLLVEGLRPKDIGERLQLSPKTVDTYRASLMHKLDIHDVAGLVKFAITKDLTTTARHA